MLRIPVGYLPPLGYDGSIAYPWCPHYGGIGIQLPWRCGSATEPSFGRTRFDRRRIQSLGSQRRAPASNTPCSVALPKRSFLSKKHIFYNQINIVYSEYLKIPLEFRSAPLGGTKGTKGFQLDIRSGTYGMRSNRLDFI